MPVRGNRRRDGQPGPHGLRQAVASPQGAGLLGLSDDLPERIEIIDSPSRIAQLLPVLEAMVNGGLILVQDVRVLRYEPHAGSGQGPAG